MTENKRFESYHDGEEWTVRDKFKKRLYLCSNDLLTEELCDLLNDLNDENEQLKSEIKDLNDVLARYEEKELEEWVKK